MDSQHPPTPSNVLPKLQILMSQSQDLKRKTKRQDSRKLFIVVVMLLYGLQPHPPYAN